MDSSPFCPNCGVGALTVANTEFTIESSPVHALLYSNLPPSTLGQSNAARQTLQEAQNYLHDVDKNILQISAALQRLLEKRTVLHNYVEAHKGIISSLRKVPNEILSEVFVHALPTFPFKMSENQIPLLFERVCKRWKDISRSTPALWSYISLEDHGRNIGNIDRDLKYISTCLARSGEYPLSISLIGPTDFDPVTKYPENRYPALVMLAAHSERWRRLTLRVPMEAARKLEMVKGRLSLLSSLDLEIYNLVEADHTTLFDAFSLAPKLRHLETSSMYFAHDVVTTGVFSIPWKGLTSLVMDYRETEVIWGILLGCTSLVVLEAIIYPDHRAQVHDVKLQYLRSLSLTLPSSSTMLSTLILPALTHACFMIENLDDDFEPEEAWHVYSGLDKMLSRSRCVLLKLDLWDNANYFREWDFVECLEAVPSLHELILCPILSSLLLKYILYSSGACSGATSEMFLPNLKELVLWARDAQPNYWPHNFDLFLRSFCTFTSHSGLIQSFKLRTDEDGLAMCRKLGILETLRVLRSEGMDVKVVDRDESLRWL
ncbi:hypothetical protein HWV62_36525 [Athelia sp. TMB]|nr:hypothetical protein HWV62_36525 [Athelia sp. TMB]